MEFSANPSYYLKKVRKAAPDLWRFTASAVNEAERCGYSWPNTCLVPFSAFYAMALSVHPDDESASRAPIYAALVQWSYSQGIYDFDPDALNALAETIPNQAMPADVLLRLPEYCVYVRTNGLDIGLEMNLSGFWAHIDYDVDEAKHYLRVLLNVENYGLTSFSLELGPWTAEEALVRALRRQQEAWSALIAQQIRQNDAAAFAFFGILERLVNPLTSILLYLCQEEPDIDGDQIPGASERSEASRRLKNGWRWSPARKTKTWSIGARIGQQLRQVSTGKKRKKHQKAAHFRKAHWRRSWKGPRDGKRWQVPRWIAPTMVGVREPTE